MNQSSEFEAVIGLEIHSQLMTQSKMFSSSENRFGSAPNTLISPVCTGQPGTLPVINQKAIELGIRAALALKCQIHEQSVFSRKHYFYPDLPKGYQISQYDEPYCTQGEVIIHLKNGEQKRISITRIHFEEDAGKLNHGSFSTSVDLNRAGVPLIEIVSGPDMRTSEEAGQYLRAVHSVLCYAEITDGNMERGNFRCDANISVRKKGATQFGTKIELKNINSFRYVEKAIDYEIERQIECISRGEKLIQQTRGWNSEKGTTELMRLKEDAQDYRYFPEPDLPPLIISKTWQEKVLSEMPELPEAKRSRFESQYQLSRYDASVLTASKELSIYFEEVVTLTQNAKVCANWIMNELLGRLNALGKTISDSPVSSTQLSELILLIQNSTISGKIAKTVFDEMFTTSDSAKKIIEEKGFIQVSDTNAIESVIQKVIEQNPNQYQEYKSGKIKLFGFFVGQVMKEMKGQGNPNMINDILKSKLDENK